MEKKCVKMLHKATTDQEKIAAMMMIPHLLKDKVSDVHFMQKLLDAVGVQFIIRLIRTGSVPEECTQHQYKHVAVSVLAYFISEPQMTENPSILKILPYLKDILDTSESIDSEADMTMMEDTYSILAIVSTSKRAVQVLMPHNVLTALCYIIVKQAKYNEKAFDTIRRLASVCGPDLWKYDAEGLRYLIQHSVEQAVKDESLERFDKLRELAFLLENSPQSLSKTEAAWIWNLHKIVFDILRSKVTPVQRAIAIRCCSAMVDLFSCDWVLGQKKNDVKLLALLTNLVDIEVQIRLKYTDIDLIDSDPSVVLCMLSLLENLTLRIGASDDDDDNVDDMRGVATLVSSYHHISQAIISVYNSQPLKMMTPLMTAVIRCYGAFLSQGGCSCAAGDTKAVIPVLVCISEDYLKSVENTESHQSDSPNQSHDITTDQSQNTDASHDTSPDQPAVNVDVISFLLPGFIEITSDPELLSCFTAHKGHRVMAKYLMRQCTQMRQQQCTENEDHTITCASVLHNTLILADATQAEITSDYQELYTWLCHWIVQCDQAQQLTFLFHLAFLLLLLAVRLKSKVTTSQSDRELMWNWVIKLLSHAHSLKSGSKGSCRLLVDEQYAKHWDTAQDLWLLSMQEFTECVTKYAEVVPCLLKSGWIMTITRIVNASSTIGDCIEMESFQQLLATAAKQDTKVKSLISKHISNRSFCMDVLRNALQL